MDNWLSSRWFKPETLQSFDWEAPMWFYVLPSILVILLLRWLIQYFFSKKLPVALTKKDIKSSPISLFTFIPPILFATALVLIVVALARPQSTNEQVEQWSEGIDIMLVIDISESMKLQDFEPNRLEAAKDVARNFVNGRFQDRIGLVIFATEAYSKSPLTTDYDLLNTYIDDIAFDLINGSKTAIGSSIAVGTNRLRESESNSKVMILLSDGENTAGNIDPVTAAKLAQAYNIKIYTIGIGKEGRVPFGRDHFGRVRYVENNLDESTLREIAKIGKGNFYRVTDKTALEQVFAQIDTLEKAEIKESRYKDTTDFYLIYLKWALVFFLGWLFLKSTFLTSAITD
ncbi:MAG: VWA domain-containing protein [Cyclobacteriaceae bacterium]